MTDFLRRADAAAYLKERYGAYTKDTLAKLAVIGGGPQFRLMGRFPVYTRDDLDIWAKSRMSALASSTAEAGSKRARNAA